MDNMGNKLKDRVKEKTDHLNQSVGEKKKQVKEKANYATNKIKNFFMKIGIAVVLIVCFCIAIKIAYARGQANPFPDDIDIIDIHIEEKLSAIGELSTYSFEYTNEKRITNSKKIFKWNIPGTRNEVDLFYSGVIKAGYEVAEIDCDVNNASKKIYVTIPQVKVFDNYIKLESIICKEKNNILNPIVTAEVLAYFEDIEKEELAIAEEKGIYDMAEEQLKTLIEALFADFNDYEVVFKN